MANKGRVLRELFLVGFVAAFIMPWGAATANLSAQLANDIYGWEPLGVIAGSSELRMHSIGQDVWEVWACDTPDGDVPVDPAEVARILNAEVSPFYRWLSDGAYLPEFRAGGRVVETASCAVAVADAVTSEPNGALIVTDARSNGGSAQSGLWCPYQGQCPPSPDTYPENYRSVTLGAHAVLGPNPRLVTVVHELGHTIHFGHNYSGETDGTWAEYDNPIDVMSMAGDRTRIMGTPALNRYIAGWIDPAEVAVAAEPGRYEVAALGAAGTQLVLVPNGEQGWMTAIDVRARSGYDSTLPSAGVTVHSLDQRPEACGSSLPCFGLSRRVAPWPAQADSYDHVLEVGDDLVLPNGWRMSVTGQTPAGYAISLTDGTDSTLGDKWVVHDQRNGLWTFRLGDGSSRQVYYGVPGDIPLMCDWDGDGVDTFGVYRPHDGFAYLRNSNSIGFADADFFYGIPSDVPLCGDWDGDGSDSLGVYRPAEQRFFLRNANSLGFADFVFRFGDPGDIPLAGDWDGDGVDSVAVYRPSDRAVYGIEGEQYPVPGSGQVLAADLDGTGFERVAWFADGIIGYSTGGGAQSLLRFGSPGQTALAGWWD